MSAAPPPPPAAPSPEGGSWSVGACLKWTAAYFAQRGLPTARLDAEVLLAHALGVARVHLYTYPEQPLEPHERASLRQLVKRRAVGEPIAYLVGEREFFGRAFRVDRRVLVPRPETEHLVEVALAALSGREAPRVHEAGCGSGAVAVTLALEAATATVSASDLSADAVAVAQDNASRLAGEALTASRLRLFCADLLDGAPRDLDLVVMNPPYIGRREAARLPLDVRAFEPELALFAGEDGLEVLARLVAAAPAHLADGGTLAVEMGAAQGPAVCALFAATAGWGEAEVTADLAGRPRVAAARWRAAKAA